MLKLSSEAILVRFSSSVFEFWPHSDSESPSVDFRVLIRNRIGDSPEQSRVGTLIQNRNGESNYLDLLVPSVLEFFVFFACEEFLVFLSSFPSNPKIFGGSLWEGKSLCFG